MGIHLSVFFFLNQKVSEFNAAASFLNTTLVHVVLRGVEWEHFGFKRKEMQNLIDRLFDLNMKFQEALSTLAWPVLISAECYHQPGKIIVILSFVKIAKCFK